MVDNGEITMPIKVTSFDGSDEKGIPAPDLLAVTNALFNLLDMAAGVTPQQLSGLQQARGLQREFNDPYKKVAQGLIALLKSEEDALKKSPTFEFYARPDEEEALSQVIHNLKAILPGYEIKFRRTPTTIFGISFGRSMTDEQQISLENRLFVLKALHNETNPEADFDIIKLRELYHAAKIWAPELALNIPDAIRPRGTGGS